MSVASSFVRFLQWIEGEVVLNVERLTLPQKLIGACGSLGTDLDSDSD